MKFAVFALSLVILAGCRVTPPVVEPAGPSLDSGMANSGVLAAYTNRTYLVTSLFAERYAALCARYGSKLMPPMPAPRWMVATGTNTFILTSDGLAAFAEMEFYSRQHLTP